MRWKPTSKQKVWLERPILEPTAESLMAGWMFAESVQLVFKMRLSKQMKMPNYGCAEPVLNIAHLSVRCRLSEAGGVLCRQSLVSCREEQR